MLGGPQRHTLLFGGSRSGKTFLTCRAVVVRAHRFSETRHVILRQKANAVRNSIFLDTMPKVFKLCFPEMKVREDKSLLRWVLEDSGSEIWTGGLDDAERIDKILGTEYATLYFNECSQIAFQNIETARSRLAQTHHDPAFVQRAYYDLNPVGNRHWTYREFVEHKHPLTLRPLAAPEQYAWMQINPRDNMQNLSQAYIDELANSSDRTRKRFLEGEYVPELDGALWNSETIERGRMEAVLPSEVEQLGISRIVIGVDPSGSDGESDDANAIGIVVMGKQAGSKAHGFVLEDATINAHPKIWAKLLTQLVDKWGADCIVAEKNFGGEMVRHVIKTENPRAAIKMVTASRGKHIRAEPVAALYEEEPGSKGGAYGGRMHHCGRFDGLEDEMCQTTVNGFQGPTSPNRLDAMVWCATELFGKSIVSPDALVVGGSLSPFPREVV